MLALSLSAALSYSLGVVPALAPARSAVTMIAPAPLGDMVRHPPPAALCTTAPTRFQNANGPSACVPRVHAGCGLSVPLPVAVAGRQAHTPEDRDRHHAAHRQHADAQAREDGRGLRRDHPVQARVDGAVQLGQGPDRVLDDSRGREARRDLGGSHHPRRAHLGQHRHRPGDGRGRKGL
eukprot:scaffold17826_cov114-Isochrysis_galbana.AAC.3